MIIDLNDTKPSDWIDDELIIDSYSQKPDEWFYFKN